jgi:multidrug efflux pump subunit AcrA (membrane-fusion protein)
MAEIRVEERRRSLGWLWALLALLVIGALAYYFLFMNEPNVTAPPATTGSLESAVEVAARAVAAFAHAA